MALPDSRVRAMSGVVNHYQRAVLDFVRRGTGHGVVEATAGSGKTTTLVEVAKVLESELLAPGERACFLAFNRSTAVELRARLPGGITATTIHALGRQVVLAAFPAARQAAGGAASATIATAAGAATATQPAVVDDRAEAAPSPTKYRDLALALLASGSPALSHLDPTDAAQYLARLADMCRLELAEPADPQAVREVAARYGLHSPGAAETAELHAQLPELLARGVATAENGAYDFTDMVYLPVRLDLRRPRFAFVCVDEAQDLSRLNLEFVMGLIRGGARALFVGDPYQAIYAFAGADARSLERIGERTGATRLPLSVSFRCPVRHVVLARRFSPDMQPAPNAVTGAVKVIPEADLARRVRPGDLVMTRTNAPLVALSLSLAERGIASRVLGDELAEETIALALRLFPTGLIVEGHATVAASAASEARRLERELLTAEALPLELDRNADRHRALSVALTALERFGRSMQPPSPAPTRLGLWSRRSWPAPVRQTVDALAAVLTALLAGAPSAQPPVILSTIHKAKGREAARVFIHRAEALGLTSGNADDDLAEGNVLFVALTRATHELVLVEAQQGAMAARLATTAATEGLHGRWDDVLRLAGIMARSPGRSATAPPVAAARLIIRHGATRRVQEPGGQAGGGGRRGGRR